MATPVFFDGKTIVLSGSYGTSKAAVTTNLTASSFGNVVLIDTGRAGAGYGGGVGSLGTNPNYQGAKSVYQFASVQAFRAWQRGGQAWDYSQFLFQPLAGVPGTPKLYYVKAAATTPGVITMNFTDYPYMDGGGTVIVKTLAEGTGANGVLNSGDLRLGFAIKVVAGIVNPAKFIFQFWQGTFKGLNTLGNPYDYIPENQCAPIMVCQTGEVSTVQELITFFSKNGVFKSYFYDGGTTVNGTGVISAGDIPVGYTLATGGTETYSPQALEAAFEACMNLDASFIFCDQYGVDSDGLGDGAIGTKNAQVTNFGRFTSKYKLISIVGGGYDNSQSNQDADSSLAFATFYNQMYINPDFVVIMHSGIPLPTVAGVFNYPSIYTAAKLCGYFAGQPPQTNPTFKPLGVIGVIDLPTQPVETQLQQGGVTFLCQQVIQGQELLVIQRGNNACQNNEIELNADGTSWSISIARIKFFADKELPQLLVSNNYVGGNANTASPAAIKKFVEIYIEDRTAKKSGNADNIFLGADPNNPVTVNTQNAAEYVNYGYIVNGPEDQIFVTASIALP